MQRSRCSQKGLLEEINHHVASRRLRLQEGTIVDASVIVAPSWTKNPGRDTEMRQKKKGNQWHFGMKVHIKVHMKEWMRRRVRRTAWLRRQSTCVMRPKRTGCCTAESRECGDMRGVRESSNGKGIGSGG